MDSTRRALRAELDRLLVQFDRGEVSRDAFVEGADRLIEAFQAEWAREGIGEPRPTR